MAAALKRQIEAAARIKMDMTTSNKTNTSNGSVGSQGSFQINQSRQSLDSNESSLPSRSGSGMQAALLAPEPSKEPTMDISGQHKSAEVRMTKIEESPVDEEESVAGPSVAASMAMRNSENDLSLGNDAQRVLLSS